MVGLIGATTATATEGLNGAGNVTVTGSVSNTDPGIYSWLPGGYSVLSAPGFGTLTITQNTAGGEGGYTWSFVFDSDDPALDALDSGSTLDITFDVRVFDVSWTGTGDATFDGPNNTAVVDTHQVTITIFGENEVCLTRGTEIATPDGQCLIEDIAVGDLVLTRDNGAKPVKWIGHSKISDARRRGNDGLEPILIPKDTISTGVPERDLAVSPQHRILLTGAVANTLFGAECRFLAAKHLCDGQRVRPCPERFEQLEYWHLMLDDHDVILANGCPVETFYLGAMSREILNTALLEELKQIFPDLEACEAELVHPELRAKDAHEVREHLSTTLAN
ncbi:MAG: Hint domain-containing protein [Litoreibacter sp.]